MPRLSGGHDQSFAVGTVIGGRFIVLGVLGRGGFGTVYRATLLDSTAAANTPLVALKVLHAALCDDVRVLKRFDREAAMTRMLEHKNIVTTLEHGRTESGAAFIAFELLEGVPLNEWATRGAASWQDTAQIGRQVLEALAVAHDAGIAHRDIKPHNIFLCDGSLSALKVLDFGIAKAFERSEVDVTKLTETGAIMGSARYMAPEQVRAGDVDHRADLYALGIMLAGLLMGKPLLRGSRHVDVLFMHAADEEHELPESVAQTPLAPVIARAIRKDRAERFQSARAMLEALVDACAVPRAPMAGARPGGKATLIMEPADEEATRVPATDTVAATREDRRPAQGATEGVDPTLTAAPWSGHGAEPSQRASTPRPTPWRGAMVVAGVASMAALGVGIGGGYAAFSSSAVEADPIASTSKSNGESKGKSKKKSKTKSKPSSEVSKTGLATLSVDELLGRVRRAGLQVTNGDRLAVTKSEREVRTDIEVADGADTQGVYGAIAHHKYGSVASAARDASGYRMIKGMRVAHDGHVVLTVFLQDGGAASAELLAKLLVP